MIRFKLTRKRLLIVALLVVVCLPLEWTALKLVKSSYSRYWAPTVVKDYLSGRYGHAEQTQHMFLLLCDHWEPGYGAANESDANEWLERYKKIAAAHHDSQGRIFQYSWFYPIDRFDTNILASLAQSVYEGFGEVEVHWHHMHSSSADFERELADALVGFTRFGALIDRPDAEPRWAFIHGVWALDNSSKPGTCGISDEISILMRNGCYADMTFPAVGTAAQPHTINRIYYATDTPEPKSHDRGPVARAGVDGEGLLMLPGPLALNYRNPKILIEFGSLDDSEGSGFSGKLGKPDNFRDYFKPPRVHLWNQIGIGVEGRRDWVFVKIHAHGMQHQDVILGGALDHMLESVEAYCADRNIVLHYICAREAYNLVQAAERELSGSPEQYYDLVIPPPLNRTQQFPIVSSASEQ